MAITTTSFLALKYLFDQAVGDSLEFDTTTNIAASAVIVSTALNAYDDAADDYFNGWWVEITEGNNAGVVRRVYDYATTTGTLSIRGANLSADASATTVRLHRYNPVSKDNAIKRAIEEIYPELHRPIDNRNLITGNILPDGHMESWSSTSAMTFWTASSGTLAKTSTAAYVRGGTYSCKHTAGATNAYLYISSNSYPRLLQLQGQTVDMYGWAYPEVADDPALVIYTLQRDGTSQSLTSSTSSEAGKWNILSLTSQTLNDDLQEIQIRLKIATDTKYVYWDDIYIGYENLTEYFLPDEFYDGAIHRVYIQNNSNSDPYFYDLHPFIDYKGVSLNFSIISDNTYKYLKLEDMVYPEHRMRIIGDRPLEALSSVSDTLTLEAHRIPLLIAKARVIFWERECVPVSTDDKAKYQFEANKAKIDFNTLTITKSMPRYSVKRLGS